MIKCESGNLRGDYTSSGYVTTDHKTVGPFITEAAEIYSDLTITIDGVRTFRIKDHAKLTFDDNREIDSVTYVSGWNDVNLLIKTKPKPKYNKCQGWVAVIEADPDTRRNREVYGDIYETLEAAKYHNCQCGYNIVGYAHIEWEEKI